MEIIEILERSSQGQTRPYICRGDDDELYFVKGRSATRRGLINEFLAASLANLLELPIAPWQVGEVDAELLESDPSGRLNDLGSGPVFASKRIVGVEFSVSHLVLVPPELRRDILFFDCWVRNGDRVLTQLGGNPNLILEPGKGTVVMIDHNLAFDAEFSRDAAFESHVFADDMRELFSDFELRRAYTERVASALANWDGLCLDIPHAWHYVDQEQTIEVNFPLIGVRESLDAPLHDEFWQTSP